MPLPIYGTLWILLIAYITRFLPYGLSTMTSTIVQLHDDLTTGVDGLRRRFYDDLSAHSAATFASRLSCRLDNFSDDLFCASSAHRFFFIHRAAEPLGPLLYHFYVDGNLGPDVFAGYHRQYGLLSCSSSIARRIGRVGGQFEGH